MLDVFFFFQRFIAIDVGEKKLDVKKIFSLIRANQLILALVSKMSNYEINSETVV